MFIAILIPVNLITFDAVEKPNIIKYQNTFSKRNKKGRKNGILDRVIFIVKNQRYLVLGKKFCPYNEIPL